jgi:hypothetical protein
VRKSEKEALKRKQSEKERLVMKFKYLFQS